MVKYPDFTIYKNEDKKDVVFYWEHCGMMGDKKYVDDWEKKKKLYEKNGIDDEKLIVTEEDEKRIPIDTAEIYENIIRKKIIPAIELIGNNA